MSRLRITDGKGPDEMAAEFRAATWGAANLATSRLRLDPPAGWRVTLVSIRSAKSGRRVNVRIVLDVRDRTSMATTEEFTKALEAVAAMAAQGIL